MTYYQTSIFDAIKSEQAAQDGITKALHHAESVSGNWGDETYRLFVHEFLPKHKRFLAEDFRAWLAANKPHYAFPPSGRAFGGIMRKAKADYYIICIGFGKVTNVNAHGTPASIWERNDERLIENGIKL